MGTTRWILGAAALVWCGIAAGQQTATITGHVNSTSDTPVQGITVRVGNGGPETTTGADGAFTLTGVTAGEVAVEVTGGGFVPQQRSVTVRAGAEVREDFRLSYMAASVDVVESLREYHLEETSLATRTPTRLIDIPQSVQVYPNQLIEDRAILEGNDLFRNVSGINVSTYSAMVFRGFTQREILYNGARGNPFGSLEGDVNNSGFSTSQIRLTNVQRVEVLKGSTSAMYGAGEPGGLVNYVTKQPKEVVDGELQLRIGSFGQKFGSGDFGGPLGKRLLARGAFYFEDRNTFRLNSGSQNSHATANLVYKINDRHRISVEGEFFNQGLDGQRLRGVPVNAAGNFLTAIQWSANEPSDRIKMIGRVLQLRGDHNFRSGWDASFTFRYLEFENNDRYHEPRGLNAATAAGQTMRREYRNFFRSNDDWSLVASATRTVRTGGLTHRLVMGMERYDQDHVFRSARTREQEVAGGQVPPLDLFRPVYGVANPALYRLSPFTFSRGNTSRTGFFGQDQIILNRYVQALVSGRVDRYNDKGLAVVPLKYEDTRFSGRAGLVVKPLERLSIYGTVANSVTRAPLFSQAPGANGPFAPETGIQGELGVKSEILNRRVFVSGAYFHMRKSNVLRPDPLLGPQGDNPNALLAVGQARSRGLEFNLEGFLTSKLYTTFNYAFVDTAIQKDNIAAVRGLPLPNAPRHTTGLFARYNFFRRTGVGFGLEGVSERREPYAGLRADGYTIADVSLYQELNSWSRVQLQVTNVANATYSATSLFAGRVGNMPGQPRAFIVTLTVNPFRH